MNTRTDLYEYFAIKALLELLDFGSFRAIFITASIYSGHVSFLIVSYKSNIRCLFWGIFVSSSKIIFFARLVFVLKSLLYCG